jgi:hypothetical protein
MLQSLAGGIKANPPRRSSGWNTEGRSHYQASLFSRYLFGPNPNCYGLGGFSRTARPSFLRLSQKGRTPIVAAAFIQAGFEDFRFSELGARAFLFYVKARLLSRNKAWIEIYRKHQFDAPCPLIRKNTEE